MWPAGLRRLPAAPPIAPRASTPPMASPLLSSLGTSLPVVAAPMAGGPSTPELVVAAARSGGLGLLAGGYQTPTALAAQIGVTRESTDRFGVNLFVPNPVPVDPAR